MKKQSLNLKTISSLFSSLRILKSANKIFPYANQLERQALLKLIAEDEFLGSPSFMDDMKWIRGAEHELGESFRSCFRSLMCELEVESIQFKKQLCSQRHCETAEPSSHHS